MTLERQLDWLRSNISLAASGLPHAGATEGLSLEPMRALMALLGDPHADAPSIHLTGTNGKGSTGHLISRILVGHGLRVGTYSSPHVSRINERIQIDTEPIGDDELAAALADVRLVAEHIERQTSYFELLTAAAFRAFSDAAVDVMVVEVGMLGRYDATNVIDARVAVLTNIAKDHTDGEPGWQDKVAGEKAGIVKPGADLVIGDLAPELRGHFENEAPGRITELGKGLKLHVNALGVGGRVIDVETPRARYEGVLVGLHGDHQGINGALGIAAAELFLDGELDRDLLDAAYLGASMPGRLEVLSTDPLIVIDGGHNAHGARKAAEAFTEEFHVFGRRILIVGMMKDKDPIEMLQALDATAADLVICCAPTWPRAMPAADLGKAARELAIDPDVVTSPEDAIDLALSLATEGDAIFVAGSLYVAGAVRNQLLADSD